MSRSLPLPLVRLLLVAGPVLALAATACSPAGPAVPARDPPAGPGGDRPVTVVTSTTVLADLIESVGGDAVRVTALVGVGGDPHVHEPRPSDAVAVADADLVVDNGLGLSPWLDALLGSRSGPVLVIGDVLSDEVRTVDGRIDPHLWMVPRIVADHYVPAIAAALTELLPAGRRGEVAQRAGELTADLHALDGEIADVLAQIPAPRRLLVTSHDAYTYFAAAYGLEVVGTVVGITTEEEPSARTVARLVEQIRQLDVPAVFVETTVNPDLIQQIAREADVRVADPLYGDSLGPAGSGADTYAGMLRTNARTIAAALTAGPDG